MEQKNLIKMTTISTVVAAIVFQAISFFRTNNFDFVGLIIFIVIFWIIFFFVQKQLFKNNG
tara:strand:+ start:2754 stop:2936 length:183 start_codon:yes stop_codon:yes gene_type:complete